jgi:hypothetical protein
LQTPRWLREYETYPARFRIEAIAPIQNKVGAFLANPILSGILTQSWSAFDLRQVMDKSRILLVNLAKGKIGEDSAGLLDALLVSRIGLAALSTFGCFRHHLLLGRQTHSPSRETDRPGCFEERE